MANDIVMVVWSAVGMAFMVAGGAIIWQRFSDYWKTRQMLRQIMREINTDSLPRLNVDTIPDLSIDDNEPTLPVKMKSN
jgi:hypothetical protein